MNGSQVFPEWGAEPMSGRVGMATHAARLEALIGEEERAAGRVMDEPVLGPRRQQMSLTEAYWAQQRVQNRVDLDEARDSLRHRIVSRRAKALTLLFLVVIDFPVMLWLTSSVFNVDWSDPLGLPLAISIVISVLGTGGAAWALYHLGHNRRESKNDRRQLAWSGLSGGAKVSLVGVGALVVLIGVVMFVRVFTEGVLSGLNDLALLLAVLVALVMLMSAALVFFTAFRDGSLEQDDLAHYSALVQAGEQRRRAHLDRANRLRNELALLRGDRPANHTGGRAPGRLLWQHPLELPSKPRQQLT